MQVCSSGIMAMLSSWRPKELVSHLTTLTLTPTQKNNNNRYHSVCIRITIIKICVFLNIGAEVKKVDGGATEFRYPSYVQHIMGWDICISFYGALIQQHWCISLILFVSRQKTVINLEKAHKWWANELLSGITFLLFICRDIFSLGFGPFRWVCTSGDPQDLAVTDDIAATVLEEISANVSAHIKQQYTDNIRWIREAGKHKMVSFLRSFRANLTNEKL